MQHFEDYSVTGWVDNGYLVPVAKRKSTPSKVARPHAELERSNNIKQPRSHSIVAFAVMGVLMLGLDPSAMVAVDLRPGASVAPAVAADESGISRFFKHNVARFRYDFERLRFSER